MDGVEPVLLGHLEFLYGADAHRVLGDLKDLMRSFAERVSVGSASALSEQDVVVIAYGDMVTEPAVSPLVSLGEFLADKVADVVTSVHLLPFYPYSSDDGFAVIDYFAVDPDLGDWEDVAEIGATFQLMFDAVLNHISSQSSWFEGFRAGKSHEDYFTVVAEDADTSAVFRPREIPLLTAVDTSAGQEYVWTTFSADQIDLNYRNPAVLLAAIEVLLTYVERGAAMIRLDAIAFIWKELGTSCIHLPQTHRIIQLMRSVLEWLAAGVILITETNVPHAENVSYFGDGTNEAQLVYNFALPPLTLHAFHKGDARVLTGWAQGMEAPSPTTAFFNFLASHDGIGLGGARGYLTDDEIDALAQRTEDVGGRVSYRATGNGSRVPYELNINFLDALCEVGVDESDELVARRFLTSQAVMLAVQGVPGIYFHSLFGSRGWVDGVATTGASRSINRQKLKRIDLEAEINDAASLRSRVLLGYRQLLKVRAAHSAFSPQAAQRVVELSDAVFAVLRIGEAGSVLCLHNLTPDPQAVVIDLMSVLGSLPTKAIDLTTGETHRCGPDRLSMQVSSYQTAWLAWEAR